MNADELEVLYLAAWASADEWKSRAEAAARRLQRAERRVAELEAQLEEQAARLSGIEGACDIFEDLMGGGTDE